ncbi:carboxylesterase/lipase family protein [Agromyces atrinae]|uniref:Carboxylic ester hydrolase n=1 Tax=Agromyces atrinae TaxID=592376 RepID=A0A852S005_9MICO|nr:carboxylesterase family protein [Agromyces atrinae]NYD66718.1 para-nitrobenzyl esterase [Agromyces atrinae]
MIVDTPNGRIAGTTTLTKRADVQCYLGIPFAQGPDGDFRFRPPVAPEPWEGTLDARSSGPAAPQNPDPLLAQSGFRQAHWSEHGSLTVNVWTPRADERRRPVLVWFHGGAYVSGSNSSGYNNGAELAATFEVVVVSINYRLGAFGFLNLAHVLGEGYEDSGNVGVLDMIAALRWVAGNIEYFGGDPDRVTVFGESAGAAAVGTLLGTPATEGLFSRAIMQSGTAERARSQAESEEITERFLHVAGLEPERAGELTTWSARKLLGAQKRFADEFAAGVIGLPLPFQPTIDGRTLHELPLDAVRRGVNSAVDLLIGTNLNEASFFTEFAPDTVEPARSHADRLLAAVREDQLGEPETVVAEYRESVAHELGSAPTDAAVLESYLSDRLYRQPSNRLLDARRSSAGSNHAYLFTWKSPMMEGRLGACHALDVPFVFRQLHRLEAVTLVGDEPPHELSDWMSAAWISFADTGRPNSAGLPVWPVYDAEERRTMRLDVDPEVLSDPRGGLRRFWAERARVESAHV